MSLLKSCADHIRAYHASLFSAKLKATHAHEIVAAALGYKTAAAMQAEEAFPVDDLLKADYLLLDVDMIADRLAQLSDLPETRFTPVEFAVAIGNSLRFHLGGRAHIVLDGTEIRGELGVADRDQLLLHEVIDPLLSQRSLARLAKTPLDPPGREGAAFYQGVPEELSEARDRSALRYATMSARQDDACITAVVRFEAVVKFDEDGDLEDLRPKETSSPWYRLDLRIDRHGGRTGYRLGSAILSNRRGESLDLLSNRAAPNLSNPFDHPEPDDLEALFDSAEDLNAAQGPLPAGTVLVLEGEPHFINLMDRRPNLGIYATHMERPRDMMEIPVDGEHLEDQGFRYRMILAEPMSWPAAIDALNKVRAINQPVGTKPEKVWIEAIWREEGEYHFFCGT